MLKKHRTMRDYRKSSTSVCPLAIKQLKLKEEPLNMATS